MECRGDRQLGCRAYAYVHSAIDQAGRAIAELLGDVGYPEWADFPGPPPDSVGL